MRLIFLPRTIKMWIISIQPLWGKVSKWLKITHPEHRNIFAHDEDDVSGFLNKDDPSCFCFPYKRSRRSLEVTRQSSQQNLLLRPWSSGFRRRTRGFEQSQRVFQDSWINTLVKQKTHWYKSRNEHFGLCFYSFVRAGFPDSRPYGHGRIPVINNSWVHPQMGCPCLLLAAFPYLNVIR